MCSGVGHLTWLLPPWGAQAPDYQLYKHTDVTLAQRETWLVEKKFFQSTVVCDNQSKKKQLIMTLLTFI